MKIDKKLMKNMFKVFFSEANTEANVCYLLDNKSK